MTNPTLSRQRDEDDSVWMTLTENRIIRESVEAVSATETDAALPPTLCQLPGASFLALCQHVRCSIVNPPRVVCDDEGCGCRR